MSVTQKHPDDSQLQRWLSGQAAEEEVVWVEEHLEQCDQCAFRLDDLQRPEDPFEARIKELAQSGDGLDSGRVSKTKGAIGKSESLEQPGTIIGAYKLIDVVGEGGMGTVWRASQEHPIKRVVAVKIIKAGMDTKEVIARFESERQALALMDHPHIARVLDAGATDAGRPYFVMEFVKGIPITEFCDNAKTFTEKRLELFCQVCDAIAHAHRKGIIHRDIKPSNILVSQDNTEPEIKVIDFGLAKATNQRLTEKTLYTQIGQLVGTPAYMSPEQADRGGTGVDTRTDVYSLGVLLYELLTGVTPFDSKRLVEAGYAEIQRVICDVDPPSPSTQLSSCDQNSSLTIATNRATNSKNLVHFIRGDLDVIVMKSLEKDRNRRYDSPNELSLDVQRFLRHEPILARPPTVAYRMLRLYERNRVAFLAASIVVAAILVGSITSAILAVKATRAAKLAEQRLVEVEDEKNKVKVALAESESARFEAEQVSELLIDIFKSPDPTNDGNTITVAEMLDRATERVRAELVNQPDRQADLMLVIGRTYSSLSLYKKAIPLLEEVVRYQMAKFGPDNFETITAQSSLANAYWPGGRYDDAIEIGTSLVTTCTELYGPDHERTWNAQNIRANALWRGGNSKDNRELVLEIREDIAERAERTLGPVHDTTLVFKNNLANSYAQVGLRDKAIAIRQEILEHRRHQFGDDHPRTLLTMELLVSTLRKNSDHEVAFPVAKEAYTRCLKVFGEEHKRTRHNADVYAKLLWWKGEFEASVNLFEKNLEIDRRKGGLRGTRFSTLAMIKKYEVTGQHEKALLLGQEFIAHAKRTLGASDRYTREAVTATARSVSLRPGATDNQLKQALDIIVDFRALRPQDKNWRPQGMIHFRQKDYPAALESFNKARRFASKDPLLFYFTAMTHWQMDEFETARTKLAKAEQLFATRKKKNASTLAVQQEAKKLIVDE